jgi:hypothetical protein
MTALLERLISQAQLAWLMSVFVGAMALPLVLFGGLLGIAVAAWPAIFVWYGRQRLAALSGLLTGVGLAWLVMVIVGQTEARLDSPPLWLAAGLIILAVGLGLAVLLANGFGGSATARRSRRPELGRDDSTNYFRDLSGRASAPGVREEEEVGRWGSTQNETKPRL